jgi:hypothetical protein
LSLVYDLKGWPDYGAMRNEDPKSDGAAITRLLAKRNLGFPSAQPVYAGFICPLRIIAPN